MKIAAIPLRDGLLAIKIFNMAGELVRPIFLDQVAAGTEIQANWDGRSDDGLVASGLYFISVQGAGIKAVRKVIVMRQMAAE